MYCKCVHSLKDGTSRKQPCLGYLFHLVTLTEMTPDSCHDHRLQGQHISDNFRDLLIGDMKTSASWREREREGGGDTVSFVGCVA